MREQNNRNIVRNGPHAIEVLNVLSRDIPSVESRQTILEKAAQIIERSVNPRAEHSEHASDGLLYGLIQSGKTSIITVAAALAADNGFQCIVVLTSDIDLLYEQTLERMRIALRGLSVLGKNDWRDANRFERFLRIPPFVIVCSKNANKLDSLLEAFRKAKAGNLSAIIIDDEADQASLNTNTSRGVGQISRINNAITYFRNYFRINTYLQVTATPQALFLQRPDHFYRPSFTVLSSPGPGYIGGDQFFGASANILRYVDLQEVESLRADHQPSPSGQIPSGLQKALFIFLIGATSKLIQNPAGENGYAFLCHVSVNKRDHDYIVKLLDRFKENIINILGNPNISQNLRLMEDLREAYYDLCTTQDKMPQFHQIIEKMNFYINGMNIKLINASSNEEIRLDSVYNIFVGGNKLGRGVTIKNLLVSYYGRNPRRPNADTVLQHARMYGYRLDNLAVTRLFLPESLANRFRLIHQMENALRELVLKYPDGKFEGLFISDPLRATRTNVLDPNSIGMYVAGSSYNPTYPLRAMSQRRNTDWLDMRLAEFSDREDAYDLSIDFIIELLEHCEPDPGHEIELWNPKTIKAALEKIKTIKGDRAYLVVRRNRDLNQPRRETQGILSEREDELAQRDAPALFIYRQNANKKGEIEIWWPQLRFPDGNYVIAFSFDW